MTANEKSIGDRNYRSGRILPGEQLGDVRQSAGGAAARDNSILSAQSLRRGQALCLLGHNQLSRELRYVRLQRHIVQSRISQEGRNLRDAQSYPRGGANQARRGRQALSGEP